MASFSEQIEEAKAELKEVFEPEQVTAEVIMQYLLMERLDALQINLGNAQRDLGGKIKDVESEVRNLLDQ